MSTTDVVAVPPGGSVCSISAGLGSQSKFRPTTGLAGSPARKTVQPNGLRSRDGPVVAAGSAVPAAGRIGGREPAYVISYSGWFRSRRVRLASVRSSVGVSGTTGVVAAEAGVLAGAGVLTGARPDPATGTGSAPEHPASPAVTSTIPRTDHAPHRIPPPCRRPVTVVSARRSRSSSGPWRVG